MQPAGTSVAPPRKPKRHSACDDAAIVEDQTAPGQLQTAVLTNHQSCRTRCAIGSTVLLRGDETEEQELRVRGRLGDKGAVTSAPRQTCESFQLKGLG